MFQMMDKEREKAHRSKFKYFLFIDSRITISSITKIAQIQSFVVAIAYHIQP